MLKGTTYAHAGEGLQHAGPGAKKGGPHVGGLLAEDVDHSLLELAHLALDLGLVGIAEVGVRPSVRGDLVAAREGLLDGGGLVVDAAVEGAGHEEGGLATGGVQRVDELGGVCVGTKPPR